MVIPEDGPDQNIYGEYRLKYRRHDSTNDFGDRYWYRPYKVSVVQGIEQETHRNYHFKTDAEYTVRVFHDAPAPAKPTGLSAAPGDTWVELTWTNPNNDDIKQWDYRQKTTGDWSAPVRMGGDPDKTSHRAWRLTNGTAYQFQIRAWSENAKSDWSDAASVTPKTAPDAPTRFRATPGSEEVRLQWELPADSTISQWQYRYKTVGDYGSWTELSTTASTRSYTVTGLTNGTEYTFQVRANTGTGNSRVLGDSSGEWSATPAASPTLSSGTLTAGTGADKLYPDCGRTAPTVPTRAIPATSGATRAIPAATVASASRAASSSTGTRRTPSAPSAIPAPRFRSDSRTPTTGTVPGRTSPATTRPPATRSRG